MTMDTSSPGLRHLVASVRALVGDGPPGGNVADTDVEGIAALVSEVLGERELLPEGIAAARPPEGFGKYLLFASPAFVVFSTCTEPGVAAPIHDHGSWGAVGLWRGREEEVRYRQPAAGGVAGPLAECGRSTYAAGEVMVVPAPPDDVHQVFNTGGSPSISLHLFAGDLVASGFRVWASPAARPRHTGPLRYDAVPMVGRAGRA